MAITIRKGQFVDFDPSKMLPGEWAVVLDGDSSSEDGKSIYMCFSAGIVKRMATYEDMVDNINKATEDVQNMFTEEMRDAINKALAVVDSVNEVISNAQSAIQSAETATNKAEALVDRIEATDLGGLQIGGRNLAQKTSGIYGESYTSFTGTVNQTIPLAKVLTEGLQVGDTVTVRLCIKYENITVDANKVGTCRIQGNGNVTNWLATGTLGGESSTFNISENGEHIFLYNFRMTEDHIKNEYWSGALRCDYIQSGSISFKEFKVERGTIATDWAPALEDTPAQIICQKLTAETLDDLRGETYTKYYFAARGNKVERNPRKGQAFGLIVIRVADGAWRQIYKIYNSSVTMERYYYNGWSEWRIVSGAYSDMDVSTAPTDTDFISLENTDRKKLSFANLFTWLKGKLGVAATHNVANNATTTSAGYVADARQIKVLSDKMANTSTQKSYVENGIAWDIYTIILNDFAIVTAKTALQRIPITTSWGSGVYASDDINTDFTFPIPFREPPAVQVTTTNDGNNAWAIVTSVVTATNAPRIQLCRGTAIPNGAARIYIQCIGLVDYQINEE